MARQRARSPVFWIRRLLLAVGILGVGSLILMLAAYRFGKSGLGTEDSEEPAPAPTDDAAITAGKVFDFVHTIEGRRVFRIRAEKSLQDRDDTIHLETVILDVFREDGETYRVTSNSARVNERTWEARLEGDVVVAGWGELELEARALDLQHGGQVLVSLGAVRFRYPPDLEGRATNLRLDRGTDTISLSGGVHIRNAAGTEIPIRLDCERLIFRRGEGLFRALDDVYIRHGEQELAARALTIFLLDDQKSLRSLRARWNVTGNVRSATDFGGETRMEFRGDFLQLEPSPEDPTTRTVRLEGSDTDMASVKVVDAEGLGRTLRAQVLNSVTVAGRPVSIEGQGRPLLIDEFLDLDQPYPLRQLCARKARALFLADGGLGQIVLNDRVELWDRDFHLSGGSQAVLDLDTGKIAIEGPSVELFSERGDIAAPRITYSRESGLIRAVSGVRASLEPSFAAAFAKTPFGHGQGPIRVESTEALYTEDPAAFTFLGGVRAWRDENILLAEQLRGDQSTDEMSASGGVRTLWFSAAENGGSASPSEPIEVTSEHLTYRRTEGTVVYTGDVKVEQASRVIACGELSVELDDAGSEARRMICREDVKVLDSETGRQVLGDSAVYSVAEDRVEVYGDNVRLIDSQNNRLKGRYLLYDLEAGTVQIQSRPPADGRP